MRQPSTPDEAAFLASMASRYVRDTSVVDALAYPDRIIHRIMDLGTPNDVLAPERALGRAVGTPIERPIRSSRLSIRRRNHRPRSTRRARRFRTTPSPPHQHPQ